MGEAMTPESDKTSGYSPRERALKKFDELLLTMRRRGESMLPTERELGVLLNCSRETVRRVLERKEAEGVVDKRGRDRIIPFDVLSGAKAPLCRFAFIAVGSSIIGNTAWSKLWAFLQRKAEAAGMVPELRIVHVNPALRNWDELLKDLPEIVVLTSGDREMEDRFAALEDKVVIGTDEFFTGRLDNIVCRDCFATGEMAAEMLAKSSYRKPAFAVRDVWIGEKLYLPFVRTGEGFAAGCRKHGLPCGEEAVFRFQGFSAKGVIKLVKKVPEIVSRGFDSVFLYADDELDFFYEALLDEGVNVPDDFGVVTVNAQDRASTHSPAVSAVSHGSEPVAAKIVEKIKWLLRHRGHNIGLNLVKPSFHPGSTLR